MYFPYFEFQSAGVEFPPREENSVPIFTPPQTHPIAPPIVHPTSPYEEAAVQASLETDASGLRYMLGKLLYQFSLKWIKGSYTFEQLLPPISRKIFSFQGLNI